MKANLSWSEYQEQQKNGWPIFKNKTNDHKLSRNNSTPHARGKKANPPDHSRDGKIHKEKPYKRTSDN